MNKLLSLGIHDAATRTCDGDENRHASPARKFQAAIKRRQKNAYRLIAILCIHIFLLNHAQWRQPEQYRMSLITLSEALLNCARLYVCSSDGFR